MNKKKKMILAGCCVIAALALGGGYLVYQNQQVRAEAEKKSEEQAAVKKEAAAKVKAEKEEKAEVQKKAEEEAQKKAEEEAVRKKAEEEATAQAAAKPGTGKIVAIDPGHMSQSVDPYDTEPNGPGSDEMKAKDTSGTSGSYTGLPEYQLNLDVSLKLRTALEALGYQVVLTRDTNDLKLSCIERAAIANDSGADIYIRIHANGSENGDASGALALIPSVENAYNGNLYEPSNRLAQCVLDAYCGATGFGNLGVQCNDTMTGNNWSSIPVMILEMGFMTNESDDMQMTDDAFQNAMVQGIVEGINAYYGQ